MASETLDELVGSGASRADVLLRLGQPSEICDGGRVFVYGWTVAVGWWTAGVAGAGGELERERFVAIRFGSDGTTVRGEQLYWWAADDARTRLDRFVAQDGSDRDARGSGDPAGSARTEDR